MERKTRLLELFEGAEFKMLPSDVSTEEFKEIARHNQEQCAIIKSRGDEHIERVQDLLCLVLAETFRDIAREKYGDISDSSLYQVLTDMFCGPEAKSGWIEEKGKALEALQSEAFTDRQLAEIGDLMDRFPEMIVAFLYMYVDRLKLVPIKDASSVSRVLAQMMKEADHADD